MRTSTNNKISEAGQHVHSQLKKSQFAHFEYDEKKIRFRLESKEESTEDKTDRYRRKAENSINARRYKTETRRIIAIAPDEICLNVIINAQTDCFHIERYIIDLVSRKMVSDKL